MTLEPLQYLRSKKYRGTIVVVGGNIGHDAIFFSRSCTFGRVVTVDGIETAAKNLLKNISRDQYRGAPIEILPTFVSNRPELFFNVESDGRWFATEVPVGPDSIQVSAITLDEVCAHRRNIEVIKINADAHELEILESGSETLRRHRPDLCVEISFGGTELITRLLESHGYFQAEALSHMNCYFVHVGRIAVAISRILNAAPFWIASRSVWRWKRMISKIAMTRRRWRLEPIETREVAAQRQLG
jgi:FkbM family methyltransferase